MSTPRYELLYHPGIPGRGEYVRLAFEATSTPYTDVANAVDKGYDDVLEALKTPTANNPSIFAPPALRVAGAGRDGETLLISQTSNILLYLGDKLGLVPADEAGKLWVNELVLTALDLQSECHDTHHPVGVSLYYDEQKPEALRRATEFREKRLPKYFAHFEDVLEANPGGEGRRLVGDKLTTADTTLWQVLDGLFYAFPKAMVHLEGTGKYELLLKTFYQNFRHERGIKDYLASDRRLKYGMGIFRHYPELDRL